MVPKKAPQEQPLDQGQLFAVEVSRLKPAEIGEVGAVFPDELEATSETDESRHFHEVIHEAVVAEQQTRNRRGGNRGKHSPLQRDGSYENIQPGDFLPGFGPVKERNWEDAKAHAKALESERLAKQAAQPTLAISHSRQEVKMAVDEVADKLDIRHGIEGKEPTPRNQKAEVEVADTQMKLIGLRDDDRAGFLPTTHREKSQGYELLSYLEPGRYEKGVSTRLDQIFFKQQSKMQEQGMSPQAAYEVALDSVRSVVSEWGDYLADSRTSWKKLRALGLLIDETPNPKLTVEEMLDDEGQGETIAQLIRYDVLRKYREGQVKLGFDPLWVRENRTNPTDEKHKIVEDMFTHKDEQFMAAYIRRRAQMMNVGQVRKMAIEALHDQVQRGKFWNGILKSVNQDYQQYAELALQRTA